MSIRIYGYYIPKHHFPIIFNNISVLAEVVVIELVVVVVAVAVVVLSQRSSFLFTCWLKTENANYRIILCFCPKLNEISVKKNLKFFQYLLTSCCQLIHIHKQIHTIVTRNFINQTSADVHSCSHYQYRLYLASQGLA